MQLWVARRRDGRAGGGCSSASVQEGYHQRADGDVRLEDVVRGHRRQHPEVHAPGLRRLDPHMLAPRAPARAVRSGGRAVREARGPRCAASALRLRYDAAAESERRRAGGARAAHAPGAQTPTAGDGAQCATSLHALAATAASRVMIRAGMTKIALGAASLGPCAGGLGRTQAWAQAWAQATTSRAASPPSDHC